MADSMDVLNGLIVVYTSYAIAIISLVAWFAYKITKKGEKNLIKPAFFYTWVCFLIVLGVSIHFVTYNTIPWAPMDLNRKNIKADKVFNITVANHAFHLPAEKLKIKVHDKVLFKVMSGDLTYGFGLFRKDNTMLLQMQVIPGHLNDILWQFDKPGVYSIRSTEYSGPAGTQMILKDAVEVTD
ncbi:MAG: cytochrome C oxidase subunit II [Bacteroidota bacterium]|nr:cytochrome C oxidase subunit II [Bacteroidota bacterium]